MKKIFSILAILCAAFMVASCSSDIEKAEEQGFLKLDINTLTSTHTRVTGVPNGYNAKTLHVELRNAEGTVVMQTDDFEHASDFQGTIVLAPGTYTIEAHSANWDGTDSGFGTPYYTGFTTVTVKAKELTTANLTCVLANVKVTVNYDTSFRTYFSNARTIVESSIYDVAPRTFVMGSTVGSAYFPVGNLTFMVHVTSKSDGSTHLQENTVTDVRARDHIIITYKVAEAGKIGGITVKVDDATQTYTYTVEVPRKSSTSLQANNANAFGHFALLSGLVSSKTTEFDPTAVTLQYKSQNATDWTTVANNALTVDGDNYSYKLTGLTPSTTYSYRFVYTTTDGAVNSNEVSFTTESEPAIYNGGFENWWKDGSVWYPNAQGTTYWDSSNPGSASMGESYNVTTSTTSPVHSGSYAAKLASTFVVIKFAAASIYTGQFGQLVGTKGAILNWGVPFTGRPTSLHGYLQYAPGPINRGTQPAGAPAKNSDDVCQIYCVLTTSVIQIDNTKMDEFPDWQTDSRVVAYGSLPANECVNSNGQWKEFNIPLVYRNLSTKPTHLIIVCSSSKYGDYFYGSDSSVLYLDDFEMVYGDTHTVQ